MARTDTVRRPRVACIGDLIEDIVVRGPALITRHTDNPSEITRARGGSAANVAIDVQLAGGIGRFIGTVGDDLHGDALLAELAKHGLELAVRRSGHTGSIVALIDELGDRTFYTDRGAATTLTEPDPTWLDDCAALHVPTYSFDVEPLATSARILVDFAKRRGLLISIDASSVASLRVITVEGWWELIDRCAPDLLFANADEADFLGLDLSTLPPATLAYVKDGPRPTRVLRGAAGLDVLVGVPPVDRVVDTTGAGDAFAAACIVALLQGESPTQAATRGHAMAASTITTIGATPQVSPPPTEGTSI